VNLNLSRSSLKRATVLLMEAKGVHQLGMEVEVLRAAAQVELSSPGQMEAPLIPLKQPG